MKRIVALCMCCIACKHDALAGAIQRAADELQFADEACAREARAARDERLALTCARHYVDAREALLAAADAYEDGHVQDATKSLEKARIVIQWFGKRYRWDDGGTP